MKKLTMFFATMAFAIPAPLAVPSGSGGQSKRGLLQGVCRQATRRSIPI